MGRPLSNQIVHEPQAIEGILRQLEQAWMEGYIRPDEERKLKVRCALQSITDLAERRVLVLGQLSAEGLERLQGHKGIELNFYDEWSNFLFHSEILEQRGSQLLVAMPSLLEVYERRQHQRFRTEGLANPRPILIPRDPHLTEQDQAEVLDISVGGLCVATSSLGIVKRLRTQAEGLSMQLHLPEAGIQEISCQLRWVKPELKEQVPQALMLGLAFHEPPRELLLAVGRYIKSLQGQTLVR